VTGIDATTWQAIGLTLTVVGLLLSVLVWRRRGAASGLRGVAWSLLPAAAGLTGTLRLLAEIGSSIAAWALRLVFSPVVWIGVTMAGVSLLLFVVTAAMRARGVGTAPDRRTAATSPDSTGRRPTSTGASTRAAEARPLPRRPGRPKAEPGGQCDNDLDDIEAILRKHGIS